MKVFACDQDAISTGKSQLEQRHCIYKKKKCKKSCYPFPRQGFHELNKPSKFFRLVLKISEVPFVKLPQTVNSENDVKDEWSQPGKTSDIA
jgi:hypothetical protein